MEHFISPHFRHNKLEEPELSDLVDIFEDLWGNLLLEPARMLLNTKYGDVPAMSLLCSYYEAIESYFRGESSQGRSGEFFVAGFCRVFAANMPGIESAAKAIYKHIRCGLAHESMVRYKVNYSRAGANAFYLTYPRKVDGTLDLDAEVVSIIVNPLRIHEITAIHFQDYLNKLRAADDIGLSEAFERTARRQWGIGQPELVVGMTEAEFLGT